MCAYAANAVDSMLARLRHALHVNGSISLDNQNMKLVALSNMSNTVKHEACDTVTDRLKSLAD